MPAARVLAPQHETVLVQVRLHGGEPGPGAGHGEQAWAVGYLGTGGDQEASHRVLGVGCGGLEVADALTKMAHVPSDVAFHVLQEPV
jgi:hypothetical protein